MYMLIACKKLQWQTMVMLSHTFLFGAMLEQKVLRQTLVRPFFAHLIIHFCFFSFLIPAELFCLLVKLDFGFTWRKTYSTQKQHLLPFWLLKTTRILEKSCSFRKISKDEADNWKLVAFNNLSNSWWGTSFNWKSWQLTFWLSWCQNL